MAKRRVVLNPEYLNAEVREGRGCIAVVWSGNAAPDMRHVERHAREIQLIPELITEARNLLRVLGDDRPNDEENRAAAKLNRILSKVTE